MLHWRLGSAHVGDAADPMQCGTHVPTLVSGSTSQHIAPTSQESIPDRPEPSTVHASPGAPGSRSTGTHRHAFHVLSFDQGLHFMPGGQFWSQRLHSATTLVSFVSSQRKLQSASVASPTDVEPSVVVGSSPRVVVPGVGCGSVVPVVSTREVLEDAMPVVDPPPSAGETAGPHPARAASTRRRGGATALEGIARDLRHPRTHPDNPISSCGDRLNRRLVFQAWRR